MEPPARRGWWPQPHAPPPHCPGRGACTAACAGRDTTQPSPHSQSTGGPLATPSKPCRGSGRPGQARPGHAHSLGRRGGGGQGRGQEGVQAARQAVVERAARLAASHIGIQQQQQTAAVALRRHRQLLQPGDQWHKGAGWCVANRQTGGLAGGVRPGSGAGISNACVPLAVDACLQHGGAVCCSGGAQHIHVCARHRSPHCLHVVPPLHNHQEGRPGGRWRW